MNTVRWNPLREMSLLRNEFDRLFDEAFTWPTQQFGRSSLWQLPLDVAESADAFVITASLPGFDPESVDVTIADNVLTIKAEQQNEQQQNGEWRYHLRERQLGSFQRSITLPTAVNADQIEASYNHGVLTLTVPKAEEVKPRRIQIGVGNGHNKMIEGNYSNS